MVELKPPQLKYLEKNYNITYGNYSQEHTHRNIIHP